MFGLILHLPQFHDTQVCSEG